MTAVGWFDHIHFPIWIYVTCPWTQNNENRTCSHFHQAWQLIPVQNYPEQFFMFSIFIHYIFICHSRRDAEWLISLEVISWHLHGETKKNKNRQIHPINKVLNWHKLHGTVTAGPWTTLLMAHTTCIAAPHWFFLNQLTLCNVRRFSWISTLS